MSVLNFYACINQKSHSGGKKRKKGREGKIYNVGWSIQNYLHNIETCFGDQKVSKIVLLYGNNCSIWILCDFSTTWFYVRSC